MSLPRNSDTGLASWTLLRLLSATGLPGAAFSCNYLASPRAHLPGAPAPPEPRWTLHVVEATQPPPSLCCDPRPCAGPPGVASCCCHHLRVLLSPWSLTGCSMRLRSTGLLSWLMDSEQQLLRGILSLQANASPGQLVCLPRPLCAWPRPFPAIHLGLPRWVPSSLLRTQPSLWDSVCLQS
jgi:hypothetical protein